MIPLPVIVRRAIGVLLDVRHLVAAVICLGVGLYGLTTYPWPVDDPMTLHLASEAPRWATALATTYHTLWFSTPFLIVEGLCSVAFILVDTRVPLRARPLPPYPPIAAREDLCLVLGELHHPTDRRPSPAPQWLTIPARGCYAGILILGATGSGKTAGAMYPYCEQLFGFQARNPSRKVAGLVLEVKGDFCRHVSQILTRYGRAEDYREISLARTWRYNPLAPGADPYALAYTIASLMTQVFGRGKDPFWELAAINLLKHLILLHQLLHQHVTLADLYASALNPESIALHLDSARHLAEFKPAGIRIAMSHRGKAREVVSAQVIWQNADDGLTTRADATPDLQHALAAAKIPFTEEPGEINEDRQLQWTMLRLWYEHDWLAIDTKLRTSIVEGISVFLSVFASHPAVHYVFCPPKDAKAATVLPAFDEVIQQGLVVGVNFPAAANPALARIVCTLMKVDLYRALLERVPRLSPTDRTTGRDVALVIDESQLLVTAGQNHPGGDEQMLGLSRQARLIPIFATHGFSSWRSTLPGESWRTLMQQLRTRVVLAQTDDFSAQTASDLFGSGERLRPSYAVNETSHETGISWLSGRTVGGKPSLGATKTYAWHREPRFDPSVFLELKNMEAIAAAYDGVNPIRAQRLYLKPQYLPVQRTHFEQVARGAL